MGHRPCLACKTELADQVVEPVHRAGRHHAVIDGPQRLSAFECSGFHWKLDRTGLPDCHQHGPDHADAGACARDLRDRNGKSTRCE